MFKFKPTGLLLTAGTALAVAVACSGGAPGSGELGPGESGPTPDDVASFPTPLDGLSDPVEPQTADVEAGSDGPGKPTGKPPALDTSIAGVPLDEVLFDTFQGGFISLEVATESDIDRLRDAIIPIYEPKYDGPEGGDWLDDSDVVLGYESDSGAYAYPVKMLNLHEIVNDVIDGVPVLISYCPLCASGVVYSRVLDGKTLVFGNTSALYESDLIMFDWETGSYWHQVIGEAIVGPLTGRRLTALPSRMTTWSQWKALHPETRILSKNLGLLRGGLLGGNPYARDPFVGYDERVNSGGFAFPVSPGKLDGRLRPGDFVLALDVDGVHVAYPLSRREAGLINTEISGRPVVVLTEPEAPGGIAFFAEVDGRALTFELGVDGVIRDNETASVWDAAGRALSGALAGAVLEAVPARTSFWFSIVGAVPDIELRIP